jgi:hypothetical protein
MGTTSQNDLTILRRAEVAKGLVEPATKAKSGGKNDHSRMLNFYGLGFQRSAEFNLRLALAYCHGRFAQD